MHRTGQTTTHRFIMACIELHDTGQNSLSHWKAKIWLPVAFKNNPGQTYLNPLMPSPVSERSLSPQSSRRPTVTTYLQTALKKTKSLWNAEQHPEGLWISFAEWRWNVDPPSPSNLRKISLMINPTTELYSSSGLHECMWWCWCSTHLPH